MSSLAIELPRKRFSEIDFLLVAVWAAFGVAIAARPTNPFMVFAAAGGGVLVAAHFFQVFYLGQASRGNLIIAATAPVFMLVSASGLGWVTAHSSPLTLDALLVRTDFGIAQAVMSWTQVRAWRIESLRLAYYGLPMAMMLGIGGASDELRGRLERSILLGSVLVLPCYLIFPAVGPAHVGQPGAAPNCMPSMHMTWAFLIWINSRGWMKRAASIYVVLTAAATLATGEHYVIDLIAAVPWTWMLNRLADADVWARLNDRYFTRWRVASVR